jgi:tetratricopeptide (TPR) repeat protein
MKKKCIFTLSNRLNIFHVLLVVIENMTCMKTKKLILTGAIILIIVLTEIILHAISYHKAYQFFQRSENRYIINRTYHYFEKSDLPLLIAPNFSAKKDSMTFRVFCLGDAVTQGFPYPHHAAYPALLQQLLDSLQTNYEVVNCALPGFDSRALSDMGHDLINRYQPDLLILMTSGSNEKNDLFNKIPYINIKETPLALLSFLQIQYERLKHALTSKNNSHRTATYYKENIEPLIKKSKNTHVPMLICTDSRSYLPAAVEALYDTSHANSLTDSIVNLANKLAIPVITPDDLSVQPPLNSGLLETPILLNTNHPGLAKALFDYLIKNDLVKSDSSTLFPWPTPCLTNLDHLIAQLLLDRFYQNHSSRTFSDSIAFDTTSISQIAQEFFSNREKNPGQLHIALGDRYRKKNRLDNALREYRAALAFEPTAGAYNGMGHIYIEKARRASKRRSDKNLADRYFQQSLYYNNKGLSLYFGNIDLTFNLGLLYFIRNDKLDTALEFFNEVLAQNPDNKNAMKYIAQIYLRLKEYAKARDFLQKALRIFPGEAQFHADLSLVYVAEHNIDEAERSIKQAYSLKPTTQNKYLLYQIQSLRLKKENKEVIANEIK